jgi:ribosome maturation factor RimP
MKLSVYRGIPAKVLPVAEPIVTELGYELWDIEYYKEGTDQILCITLDSEEGINIEDCEKVSRALDLPLDEADPIPCEYCLQVSSPGIERDLKKAEHFECFIGEEVRVGFYSTVKDGIFAGMKTVDAVLSGFSAEDASITLSTGDAEETVSLEKVTGVKTVFDF